MQTEMPPTIYDDIHVYPNMSLKKKQSSFDRIMVIAVVKKRLHHTTFDKLVRLCNDPEMASYVIERMDILIRAFMLMHVTIDAEHYWEKNFASLFNFLRGRSVDIDFSKFAYLDIKNAYILRALRSTRVANFRELWEKALLEHRLRRSIENYCRIRGVRRIARMIWKGFSGLAYFRYYKWAGEFGDLDRITIDGVYAPPDKPCELLAHSGNFAVVRIEKKRFVLVRNGNMECIILPFESKTRDLWQVLANMAI